MRRMAAGSASTLAATASFRVATVSSASASTGNVSWPVTCFILSVSGMTARCGWLGCARGGLEPARGGGGGRGRGGHLQPPRRREIACCRAALHVEQRRHAATSPRGDGKRRRARAPPGSSGRRSSGPSESAVASQGAGRRARAAIGSTRPKCHHMPSLAHLAGSSNDLGQAQVAGESSAATYCAAPCRR